MEPQTFPQSYVLGLSFGPHLKICNCSKRCLNTYFVNFSLVLPIQKSFSLFENIDDLSRFVLTLLCMRMQEFSAGNKNINKSER